MEHILDNPIWNALITSNSNLAQGNDEVRFLNRDVGTFAGLKENSVKDLSTLLKYTPLHAFMVLFTPEEISVSDEWEITVKKPLLQMVYLHKSAPLPKTELVSLRENDVPAMLSLTALTEPGPFLPGTIELGNYEGIFEKESVVAMAGQRLQPDPYVEISAVCTHPDHTGRGYAAMLVSNQIHQILAASKVPFLHVLPENIAARRLYDKLGFELRKEMTCYVLTRIR